MEIQKTKYIFAKNVGIMKYVYKFILFLALSMIGNLGLMAQDLNEIELESVEPSKELPISIAVYNNTLYIVNAKENEVVSIMNMLGENVMTCVINSQDERIQLNLKKGFYIVKVSEKIQRIIIK